MVSTAGDIAQTAPGGGAGFEDLVDCGQRHGIALRHDAARVGDLDLRPPLVQLAHEHGDALEHVDGLEARDHTGDAVFLRQELEGLGARDGAHVARQDEGVEFEVRVLHQRFQGAGHVLVRGEDAEVLQAHGRGALDGHGHQRRGSLEAHAHEHDPPIGVGLRQGQRIEGRIADLHATACGLLLEQARRAAGHARHVAERCYGHVRDAREGDDSVDIAVRRDAHGAAWARREAHAFGHEVADAVARDGHGVRAAHLHERGAAFRGELADGLDEAAGELRILERRQLVLHGAGIDRATAMYVLGLHDEIP